MASKSYLAGQSRYRLQSPHCVYCGEDADTAEHFPPGSYSMRGLLLSACQECNLLAGTSYPLNFMRRAALVKGKLEHKYYNVLHTPDWSKDELAELGYSLRAKATRWQEHKRFVEARLAWNVASYLLFIDPDIGSALVSAECDIITALERLSLLNSESSETSEEVA